MSHKPRKTPLPVDVTWRCSILAGSGGYLSLVIRHWSLVIGTD
jgi:hypothetical protein